MPEESASEAILEQLLGRVAEVQRGDDSLLKTSAKIRQSAHHDFSQFDYLLPPLTAAHGPRQVPANLEDAVKVSVAVGLAQFFTWGEPDYGYHGRSTSQGGFDRVSDTDGEYDDAGVVSKLMDAALIEAARAEMSRHSGQLPEWNTAFGEALLAAFQHSLTDELRSWQPRSKAELDWLIDNATVGTAIAAQAWEMAGQGWSQATDFTPYTPGSVNFGLQTVYRQVWTPLGVQTGEIVRTLPLGPQQREKISISVTRRRSRSVRSEVSTSSERSSEESASTKDSQEVVDEAASSFNWSVSASGEYTTGFAKAKMSASAGGEQSSRSSTQKSQLNESMVKSTSKIRRDTKVVVSTESEQTFERTANSEIVNPNDEIAVTYVYSKLQRQYEISTFLGEVNTVVFVAERVPSRAELTPEWFRRHASVLADALLDDGFGDDLQRIAWGAPPSSYQTDDRVNKILDSYSDDLPDYSNAAGTPPDAVGSMALVYERELERQRQSTTTQIAYATALARLRDHVYDNILHYCRAIWQAEDPQTRLLRYSQIKVPTNWNANYLDAGYTSRVRYQPEITGRNSYEPLSEIINPAGPIGFSGNYAIYYIKQRSDWSDLLDLLAVMRQPYLRLVADAEGPEGTQVQAVAAPDVTTNMRFRVQVTETGVRALKAADPGNRQTDWDNYASPVTGQLGADGGTLQFDHFRLSVHADNATGISPGDEFDISLTVVPTLEDPELRLLRWNEPLPAPAAEARVFDSDTLARMSRYFPEIAAAIGDAATWDQLVEDAREIVRGRYHEYLMYQRYTRRLVMDTDNIVLNRIVDDSSTLEPFKNAHRYLDVLSAAEDTRLKQIESQRRRRRLNSDDLRDPDTERTVVVDRDIDTAIDPVDA